MKTCNETIAALGRLLDESLSKDPAKRPPRSQVQNVTSITNAMKGAGRAQLHANSLKIKQKDAFIEVPFFK